MSRTRMDACPPPILKGAVESKPGGQAMETDGLGRREFFGTLSLAALISKGVFAADERTGDMLYRKLGRTGERVSAIGMGGYHIGVPANEEESIRLIQSAIDRGITFMDNCWDYMDGKCETWMGKALRDGYRQKVFLMRSEHTSE